MHAQHAPEADYPSRVTPMPCAPWRVASVQVLDGFRLKARFLDGLEGVVDLSRLVASPGAGVFASLADPASFAQAHVDLGAVTWPNGADLAPDAMYRAIKSTGTWIP